MPRRRPERTLLVTGFEPFGAHRRNPSAEIARALDGTRIAGARVVGRVLPVAIAALGPALAEALALARPAVALGLGLAPGEAGIRLERAAVNLADFAVPDNRGAQPRDRKIDPGGPDLLWARLKLRAIERALLARGIPARLSSSAGTYVCNAYMYRLLAAVPAPTPCGFIHLPQSSEAVADALAACRGDGVSASLPLASMLAAVVAALEVSLGEASEEGP